jgi:hypothetical protein
MSLNEKRDWQMLSVGNREKKFFPLWGSTFLSSNTNNKEKCLFSSLKIFEGRNTTRPNSGLNPAPAFP